MRGRQYDTRKLTAAGFNIEDAQIFHYKIEEYFDALTNFVEKFTIPLNNYTAAFVVNCEEDRAAFLQDCYNTRAELMGMGMTAAIAELAILEDAAIDRNMKEVADSQIKLAATIEICIREARDAALRWMIKR